MCGLFLRLYMLGGDIHALCKGELCFILLGGVLTFFFLYTGLVTMLTYIMIIFDIYDDVYLLHLPLHVLFLLYFYTRFLLLVCNLLFLFYTKMP